MSAAPFTVVLEFARADQAGDPYAFRLGPQEYLLRGAEGGFESAELLWNEALLADLAALRRPMRDPALLPRIGELLRRFLTPLGWAQQEEQILAASHRGERVVITVRSAAAELYALPWELLTFKATGQHLGELPSILLRYEWPETRTARERPAPHHECGGRIFFAWSAAVGAVPAAEHLAAIKSACAAGFHPFDASRDVLPDASYRRLGEALSRAQQEGPPISVLHLLCHGIGAGNTFGLAWDTEDAAGEVSIIDAGQLRQLLAPYAGMVRLVVLMACDGGNLGVLGNQLGSVAQTLHRSGIAAVIASRYPLSLQGSVSLTEAFYAQLLWGPDSLESAILCARKRLEQEVSQIDWASVQLYARAADGEDTRPVVFRPYRGLAAFQPSDRRFYFGRERDIERIVKRLSGSSRLVTVVGASGAGKSSLILAGVVPELESRAKSAGKYQVRIVRPGAAPCQALAVTLARAERQAGGSNPLLEPSVSELCGNLLRSRETLADFAANSHDARLLLVVDQAEELFLQSDRAEAAAFIDNLMHALTVPGGRLVAVLTLRADFLGLCLDRPELAEHIRATMELVLPLNKEELRQAILRPAERVGLKFEEGLCDALLDAVWDTEAAEAEASSANLDASKNQTLARSAGTLPLLQFTLEQLWERRHGAMIHWHAWRSIGGVRGAIARRANETLELSRRAGELEIVQKLFGRLVQLGEGTVDTRRRARREEIEAILPGRIKQVLARWVEARLLTADESEVTIAHEALLREWETLRRWTDENRESLRILQHLSRDARRYHTTGENMDDLWHGTPLRRALSLQAAGKLPLSPQEAIFLLRSAQEAERHQSMVEEQVQRARDSDYRLGAKARTIAVFLLIALAAMGHALARVHLREVTHEVFMALTAAVTLLGVLCVGMLRKSPFNNEFNRKALSLCASAPVPIIINHWVGSRFGFRVDATQIIDLNIVLLLSFAGTITIDRSLWPVILLDMVGIAIGRRWPEAIGLIMGLVPALGILYFFLLFHKRTAARSSSPSRPDATSDRI